jgi:hypothetical protein
MGSWLAANLAMETHPQAEHHFSFTDVLYEDADCYRFLLEGVCYLLGREMSWVPAADEFPDYRVPDDTPIEDYHGNPEWRAFLANLRTLAAVHLPELHWLVEGRDPWEVFRDVRFLGNSSVDPCSKHLKRQLRDKWLRANFDPSETLVVVGIGFDERHRFDNGEGGGFGPRRAADGWHAAAPLVDSLHGDMGPLHFVRKAGLLVPRLYPLGYSHNNCGGYCCKAGHEHFRNRRNVQPERFAYDRMMERKIIAHLGADVSMLTDRSGDGEKKPLTLDELDSRLAADPQLTFEWVTGSSGCGCMIDEVGA